MICTVHQGYSGDQIKKNKKRGACFTYGGKEWCMTVLGSGGGDSRERDRLEDLGVNGRITSKWILKK
jgi:hypothetical protein